MRKVLRMLATGNSNKEIATYLNIRPSAIKQHMRTFFLELLVPTRCPMSLPTHEPGKTGTPSFVQAEMAEQKVVGVGLPCTKCRAYYPGDLTVLPDLQVVRTRIAQRNSVVPSLGYDGQPHPNSSEVCSPGICPSSRLRGSFQGCAPSSSSPAI